MNFNSDEVIGMFWQDSDLTFICSRSHCTRPMHPFLCSTSQIFPFSLLKLCTSCINSMAVLSTQEEPIRGFHVAEQLPYLKDLEIRHRKTVLSDMMNITKPWCWTLSEAFDCVHSIMICWRWSNYDATGKNAKKCLVELSWLGHARAPNLGESQTSGGKNLVVLILIWRRKI